MKKGLYLVLLFIVGISIGAIVKHNIPKLPSEEQRISYFNWISRYDLYDYEEAILKKGDVDKLLDITCEADVDIFPYLIVTYDVHKKDVCNDMLSLYNSYYDSCHQRHSRALIPLRRYLEKIIKDTTESHFQINPQELKDFRKNE